MNFLFCRRSIHFINEATYKQIQMRLFPCAMLFARQVNIYLGLTACAERGEIRRFQTVQIVRCMNGIESEVGNYVHSWRSNPFTALAFVYLCAYGTDVCGMLIAVLRRVRIEQQSCFLRRHNTQHSVAFMFSLEQFTEHASASVS